MMETQSSAFPEREGWCLLNRREFLQSQVMLWAMPNETDLPGGFAVNLSAVMQE